MSIRWLEAWTALCIGAVALVFTLMPVPWCEVPHTRDLGALLAFLALVTYLVRVDLKKSPSPIALRTAMGVLCGVTLGLVYACHPMGLVLLATLGGLLGRFGLDWAA